MLTDQQLRAWATLDIGPAWVGKVSLGPGSAPVAMLSGTNTAALDGSEEGTVFPDSPGPGSGIPPAADDRERAALWLKLAQQVEACRACTLGSSRQRSVLGAGPPRASWMLVGEAPGAEEDKSGEPFVGRAGELLDAMLRAAALDRSRDVYIANVIKCRPPGNRNPQPEEVSRCEPYLGEQVRLVEPRLLLLMGRFAAQTLLRTEAAIAGLRGRVHRVEIAGRSIPAVVTYHPAYLLRNPADKSKAWADWCLASETMASLS